MKHMIFEHKVPSSITESPVETLKSGGLPLIAPSKLPVLQLQFLKLTACEGSSKKTHKAEVEVDVVLIFRLADEINVGGMTPGMPKAWQTSLVLAIEVPV
jgi:hypothetical protein